MIMAIIGFLFVFVMLAIITLLMGCVLFFGGIDCGPLRRERYWWFIPLCCIIGWFWVLLFQNSPFSITVS